MIDRKAALVESATGGWVRTASMAGLRLRLQCEAEAEVLVYQLHNAARGYAEAQLIVKGPGSHRLDDALWTRVEVISGHKVLAFYETRSA